MVIQGSRRLYARSHEKLACSISELTRVEERTNFVAGIDESFARTIRARLGNKAQFDPLLVPVQRMLCTDSGDRYEVVNENQESRRLLLVKERKTKVLDFQIALLCHDYDLRMCCAQESRDESRKIEIDMDTYQTTAEVAQIKFALERRKKRASFFVKSKDPLRVWRVDFTEVVTHNMTSTNNSGSANVEYELEFELDESIKMKWLSESDEVKRTELARLINVKLLELINICIPTFSSHDGGEFQLDHIPGDKENHVRGEIIRINNILVPGSKGVDFLGSMPINMFRSSLNKVLSSDYYVGEKSDGVRYLMYVINTGNNDKNCVLMNRSKVLRFFPGSQKLGRILKGDCVLDGEIVYNLTLKKYVFVIFDILCWTFFDDRGALRTANVMHQKFEERIKLLEEEVISRYESASDPCSGSEVELLCKRFLPKNQISHLVKNFHTESSGEKFYYEKDNGTHFHHYTDGIIFQPNSHYVISRFYDFFKWKWADMRSVDLVVSILIGNQRLDNVSDSNSNQNDQYIGEPRSITKDNIILWCDGPSNTKVNFTKRGETNVAMGKFDTFRLLAEYSEHRKCMSQNGNIVVEVAYDTKVGMWTYLMIRPDKKVSNYIDSVIGVFTEQAEAISLEELEYSILASTQDMEQDFESLMDTVRNEIIIQQRKRVKVSK